MKKVLLFALVFLAGAVVFSQEQSILLDFSGRVEVQFPGRAWEPAARNLVLPQGTVISTGFNAFATLQVGAATIQVRPLTRMAVAELVKARGEQRTTLDVRVGRVRARVERVEGLEHDFTLKSPVSTAAIRGTEFEFSPTSLQVFEGIVRFANAIGQSRGIIQGEQSSIVGFAAPASPEAAVIAATRTVVSTRPAAAAVAAVERVRLTGTLTVTAY